MGDLSRRVLAASSCCIMVLDRAGRILDINRTDPRISPEAVRGQSLADYMRPGHRPVFRRMLAAAFKGRSGAYRTMADDHDGRETWYENRLSPLKDGGRVQAVVLTSLAISDGVYLDESTRRSLQLYSYIFKGSRDAVGYASLDGVLLDVNPAFESLTGYSRKELVNQKRYQDLTPEEFLAVTEQSVKALSESGKPVEYEKEYVRKDGSRVPILLSISLITDSEGRSTGFAAVIRDMTERKAAQRHILDAAEAERARLGRDLHDGLGQNLTGVALLAGALSAKLKGRASEDAAQARRIAALASDAVEQAKQLAQGLVPVGLDTEGLRAALRQLCSQARRVFRVRCFLRSGSGPAVEDKTVALQFYRIAQEAIHNAVRHGRAKSISLSLRRSKGCLTLTVVDDGVGIEPSSKKGLGLGIMRDRARLIGAEVEVKRRRQRGTAVVCRLTDRGLARACRRFS